MLCMKFLRNFCLLVVALVVLLCGCSKSNEDDVKNAKRFEELKVLPLDTVLSRAFAFYEQYQATNDTLLRDSMDDYKSHFIARWKRSTDSLCGTIPADDSLAADLREIYKAVLEFDAKREYRYVFAREKSELQNKEQAEKNDSLLKQKMDDWFKNFGKRREKMKENPDSVLAVIEKENAERERADSIYAVEIRAIPLDEALNRLKEDSSSIYNYAYFFQTLQVLYVDTAVTDMKELDKVHIFRIKRDAWKETRSACMEKTPMGQRILVMNKEYNILLNDFMKANVRESRSDRYTIMPNKYPFWSPMISVVPHHSGDDFHFNSFPVIHTAVFNKAHDMVKLNVMQSFNSGSYYYLTKRSGKWEVLRLRNGWVM